MAWIQSHMNRTEVLGDLRKNDASVWRVNAWLIHGDMFVGSSFIVCLILTFIEKQVINAVSFWLLDNTQTSESRSWNAISFWLLQCIRECTQTWLWILHIIYVVYFVSRRLANRQWFAPCYLFMCLMPRLALLTPHAENMQLNFTEAHSPRLSWITL